MKDLKLVYQAVSKDAAETELLNLETTISYCHQVMAGQLGQVD